MRRIYVLLLVPVLCGCGKAVDESGRIASGTALPRDIQEEVSRVPSMCLVIKDLKDRLSYLIPRPSGPPDPGFLAVPVEGKPTEHYLYPGIDSFAVSTPYLFIGCDDSADIEAIAKQASAEAKERNAPIELWAKIEGVWKARG